MNPTLETIHDLHTTHGDFTHQQIQREDLDAIIAASLRSANASGRQSYSIIVIEDPVVQKHLSGYAGAISLVYCIDFTRIKDLAHHLDLDFSIDPSLALVTGATDTALAAQTATIAARSLGIDSLLTNGIHRGDTDRVYETLGLPNDLCFPLISLVLGFAAKPTKQRKGRLDGPGIVHHGTYHRATSEERQAIVERYDTDLGLGHYWRRGGHTHYLEWFYRRWCKPFNHAADHPGEVTKQLVARGFLAPCAEGPLACPS